MWNRFRQARKQGKDLACEFAAAFPLKGGGWRRVRQGQVAGEYQRFLDRVEAGGQSRAMGVVSRLLLARSFQNELLARGYQAETVKKVVLSVLTAMGGGGRKTSGR